jgi:hypothetical protein
MMLAALIPLLGPVVERLIGLIPDEQAQAKARIEALGQIAQIAAQSDAQQSDVNKIEAQSDSLFKSGWRPAIGWVCVLALAYQYLGRPFASIWYPGLPGLDNMLWELMFGLLGMGALRSVDKAVGK